MSKAQQTILELDFKALEHNYQYLRSKLKSETQFLAVVKAFAYGSDATRIARHLEELGADYFAVAYAKEGVALRQGGITKPILVLHPQPISFGDIVEHCLEPGLYSRKILELFVETAQAQGLKSYPVHLKFNTGLNRLGFGDTDIPWIANILKNNPQIAARSVFSHLAASEDMREKAFTQGQINAFHGMANSLDALLETTPFRHLLNTSGILNYPEAQFNMVRSGIGLYGYGNTPEEDKKLRPIATLKTVISQIHEIKAGDSVGYNRAFTSTMNRRSATLPLGHADGIGRIYGNGKSHVLIKGQKAPVIGNVCMDMIMVDVTNIPCDEGDEVIVFGPGHTAASFAENAGTISYELLTGISQRVTRAYIY